jgi:hypothetical protein
MGPWWNNTDSENWSTGIKFCPGVSESLFRSSLFYFFGEGEGQEQNESAVVRRLLPENHVSAACSDYSVGRSNCKQGTYIFCWVHFILF